MWTAELSVGDTAIDAQHQGLFQTTSRLLETIIDGVPDSEKIQEVIAFLDEYIATHFAFEESYMYSYGYPETEEHKMLHQNFTEQYTQLKKKIDIIKPTTTSLLNLENFLGQWLVHHIGKEDKKYHQYIKEHRQ
ncbi:MAG: bacteriohemerythrin [Candidatus Moraniibacteriota bacterium]